MSNPLSMFKEKTEAGTLEWSMTRIAVAAFTVAYLIRIMRFSVTGAAIAFGWPDAFVMFSILFAIPFSKLFSGASGAMLLGKLLDKFGTGAVGMNAVREKVTATLERKTEPAPDQPPAPEPSQLVDPDFKPQEWQGGKEEGIL